MKLDCANDEGESNSRLSLIRSSLDTIKTMHTLKVKIIEIRVKTAVFITDLQKLVAMLRTDQLLINRNQ